MIVEEKQIVGSVFTISVARERWYGSTEGIFFNCSMLPLGTGPWTVHGSVPGHRVHTPLSCFTL